MSINELAQLAKYASKGKDNIKKGTVGFPGFGFTSIEDLLNKFDLNYPTGFCHIGCIREYF